jgi:antitoxin MazE
MVTKIQKWGNSQGLRVSRELLEKVHASIGDAVEVSVQKGAILIQPIKQLRGKHSLRRLVAQMPDDYKPRAESWGGPIGKEVW